MPTTITEKIILVDHDDQPIGEIGKIEAHRGQGRLHRAFTIFLRNRTGQWLTTQRAAAKPLWPNWWDGACSSHQQPNEADLPAAARRLIDELNLTAQNLEYVFKYEYHAIYSPQWSENEINHIVVGTFDDNIRPNPSEVSEWRWRSTGEINKALADSNQKIFAPWFPPAWHMLRGQT